MKEDMLTIKISDYEYDLQIQPKIRQYTNN